MSYLVNWYTNYQKALPKTTRRPKKFSRPGPNRWSRSTMPYHPKLRLFMKLWKTVTKAADMTLCSTKLVADEELEGVEEATGILSVTPGQV